MNRALLLLSAILIILSLGGCKPTGSVTIISANGVTKKAYIRFAADCEDASGNLVPTLVSAQFFYYQHSARRAKAGFPVSISGEVDKISIDGQSGNVCFTDPAIAATTEIVVLEGSYHPVPHWLGKGGSFRLTSTNVNKTGFNGDLFTLELSGGAYDGYVNEGTYQDSKITYIDES